MDVENFSSVIQGKEVSLFFLSNEFISCYISNYGARLISLNVPDSYGGNLDVVLGFNSLAGYLNANEKYHGATIGRYANRIAGGRFSLMGNEYSLQINNGPNSLHGGVEGFHVKVWDVTNKSSDSISLKYMSQDMEEGFPGDLTTVVTYKLEGKNLKIQYSAVSNKDTIINLTHHSYFNLNGEGSGTVLNHLLELNCEYFTPLGLDTIPSGKLDLLSNTPFDFTNAKTIGSQIKEPNDQLRKGLGYDHNFVVKDYRSGELSYVGFAEGDVSKIKMEVWSTEPGVQLYTANNLNGSDIGKAGNSYKRREAFCLETQHFPDSPNQLQFPSTVLLRGDTYRSETEYRF